MRHQLITAVAAASVIAVGSAQQAPDKPVQPPAATGVTKGTPTLEEVADGISRSEAALTARIKAFRPIVEVYIQSLASDPQLGMAPIEDEYFLGQFEWRNGLKLVPLSLTKRTSALLSRSGGIEFLPDGFAAMTVPDWRLLDRQHYQFSFVRREFLGEARCYVFDVQPLKNAQDGFSGRIWVEDRDYNVVRFNGISHTVDKNLSGLFRKKLSFHMDSWRVNVLPGLWLPAYVYSEETDLQGQASARNTRFKSQVRLWGYNTKAVQAPQQFTAILIDERTVKDDAEQGRQLSPVQSQRRWEQEAETNIVDRLEKSGLLAPAGEVDNVLNTVVNNLEVTNNIAPDSPVRCRVLLTSPLESFAVGHTIVLSRGLIDVLPDEASLAMMVAHELAHIVLAHPVIDTKFAFVDRLMIPDGDLLRTIQIRHDAREEASADAKVIELLNNSPYKDKLAGAGLFLRAIAAHARQLPNLIQPHIGDHIADGGQTLRLTELMQQAPALAPDRLDQIAALPLGARLVVDPWSGRLELLRAQAVPLVSARENVPFAVTPLMPYIKYAEVQTAVRP